MSPKEDIQFIGFIQNFGSKNLDSGCKSLKNPTSGQARLLQSLTVSVVSSFEVNNIMATRLEYFDEVMRILETFDYPSLVSFYNPNQVAQSIGFSVLNIWSCGESPMMCAIIIWSATMNYQIIPDMKSAVKH